MAIKKKIYVSGPRMGQNNSMFGIEIKDIMNKSSNKSKKSKSKGNKSGSKKRF